MANARANFSQSDLTKVLKAYKSAGYAAPSLVIEPGKITASPTKTNDEPALSGWEDVK